MKFFFVRVHVFSHRTVRKKYKWGMGFEEARGEKHSDIGVEKVGGNEYDNP